MPFVQAQTYTVVCRRLPGRVWNLLRITPLPFVGSGSGVAFVELNYNLPTGAPPVIGSIAPAVPLRVIAFFQEEDFAFHRMLFQTEAPIEIEWSTDPAQPSLLASLQTRTRSEPPGEGPADTS
ncbi:hypothetical protein [Actinoplanes sp. NPDC023714]|uniref:hypothetical protein n=1 Tax=Actinoplanes sp. NPDC023714 TaxID=3154322 RepID=UPI003408109C